MLKVEEAETDSIPKESEYKLKAISSQMTAKIIKRWPTRSKGLAVASKVSKCLLKAEQV